jgi:hypothetical protein
MTLFGWHVASGAVIPHAAEQPHNDQDNQDEAENPTEARAAVTIVAVVAAPAAEQQNHNDDDQTVFVVDQRYSRFVRNGGDVLV